MVSRREDLDLLRSRLIEALDVVEPKDLPRVSREIRAIDIELESLGTAMSPGQQLVDDLKAKRERRAAVK